LPPKTGYERDEYPHSLFLEGGRNAHVKYIDPSDNAGSGASVGNQSHPYNNLTVVQIVIVP